MAVFLLVPKHVAASSGAFETFLQRDVGGRRASFCWLATNASLGRGTGAIHCRRKARRRRTRRDKDDTSTAKVHLDDATPSDGEIEDKLSKKSSHLENIKAGAQASVNNKPFLFLQKNVRVEENITTCTDKTSGTKTVIEMNCVTDETSGQKSDIEITTNVETSVDNLAQNETSKIQVLEQVAEQVASIGQKVVDDVLPDTVVTHAVEAIVEQIAAPVVEQVASAAVHVTGHVASLLSNDQEDHPSDSDDEFEAYTTSDLPEFRGIQGLENFTVLQDTPAVIYDLYIYMLKKPGLEFALAMFAAPVMLSVLFTLLYLPQLQGLAFEDAAKNADGLHLSWSMVFQVFMFSVSLATGLEPDLRPRTPYTLVVANVNALFAQLIFVFLSGAVFARLSQPSQPIRCSPVALVSPRPTKKKHAAHRVFMTRYVLVGPQPCELVDVKVDLSYKYNTMTGSGSYFRATESLKLVRSEVAYLNHGMLVRHVIDDTSPLKRRNPDVLREEDGIFTLSVVGLERSSMQPVFHAQHYSVVDGHVIWDAEFEDMILINKKNRRILDHSRLSEWRRA